MIALEAKAKLFAEMKELRDMVSVAALEKTAEAASARISALTKLRHYRCRWLRAPMCREHALHLALTYFWHPTVHNG
jgi:hypothetical protein